MTAFQIFGYVYGVMNQHLNQGHADLPVVVPILYYRGKVKLYPYSGNFLDCFGKQKKLAKTVYSRPYSIVDLASMSDEEIHTHGNIAILDLVQKYSAQTQNIQDWVEHFVEEVKKGYLPKDQFENVLDYVFRKSDVGDIEILIVIFIERVPEYQENIMTIAKKLEAKGREESIDFIEKTMQSQGYDQKAIEKILNPYRQKIAQEEVNHFLV